MKMRVLLSVALLVVMAAPLFAGQQRSQIELTRSVIQTEKQAIVAKNMDLTEKESSEFWPLYREFQDKLMTVNDKRVRLIEDYAKNYEVMTNEKADSILNEAMSWEKDVHKLKNKYMKKFHKILPSKKVARYYQLEGKMDAVIDYELAANIPLVK